MRGVYLSLFILSLLLPGGSGAWANCPPGMSATGDGFCTRPGETYCGNGGVCGGGLACRPNGRCFHASGCYPDQTRTAIGCMPLGKVACPDGTYCDPGERCGAGGCVGGAAATGPICGGKPLRAGYACNPFTNESYDPSWMKLCGTEICDQRDACGTNQCLQPYFQARAVPASVSPRTPEPAVTTPVPTAPPPPTVKVTPPTTPPPSAVTTPVPTAPAPSTVRQPANIAPAPTAPTVKAPTIPADPGRVAACRDLASSLERFRASMGDAWVGEQLASQRCTALGTPM